MHNRRVVFFLDYANINRAASDQGIELDYGELLEYMGEGRFLVDAHVYVPVDPRNEHRLDGLIDRLWSEGYVVHRKVGVPLQDSYKCDFDVEITIDVLNTVYQVKPDIIVLGTGDGDFSPLVREVRRLGVRVEVASFTSSASRDLTLRSSGFVSLDAYVQEALHAMYPEQTVDPQNESTDPERGDESVEAVLASDGSINEAEAEPQPPADPNTAVLRTPRIPSADDY